MHKFRQFSNFSKKFKKILSFKWILIWECVKNFELVLMNYGEKEPEKTATPDVGLVASWKF